jgi:hypothetical protein
MRILLVLGILLSFRGYTQCKTFVLNDKGDTLNCTDVKGLKQGKWSIHVEPWKGEPGYEEEGEFLDDKKEGMWRVYNLMGDKIGEENYKWGHKHGISRYYNVAGLEREESWKAVNPENPYDTVDVPDPAVPYKVDRVIVKLEGRAYKEGIWKYYRSGSGVITKTETYKLDKLLMPEVTGSLFDEQTNKKKTFEKPKEIMDYERKNAGKKYIKIRPF